MLCMYVSCVYVVHVCVMYVCVVCERMCAFTDLENTVLVCCLIIPLSVF